MTQKVIEVIGTSKESFAKAAKNAVAEAAKTVRKIKWAHVDSFDMQLDEGSYCRTGPRQRSILTWRIKLVARTLDPELRRALAERVRYCHELGIYDFYRRERTSVAAEVVSVSLSSTQSELREEMPARKSAVAPAIAEDNVFEVVTPKPEQWRRRSGRRAQTDSRRSRRLHSLQTCTSKAASRSSLASAIRTPS